MFHQKSCLQRDVMENLVRHGGIVSLCKLSSRSDEAGTNALLALLNLSSRGTISNQCIEDMIDSGSVSRMVEIALSSMEDCANQERWRKRINVSLALLTNMVRRCATKFFLFHSPKYN